MAAITTFMPYRPTSAPTLIAPGSEHSSPYLTALEPATTKASPRQRSIPTSAHPSPPIRLGANSATSTGPHLKPMAVLWHMLLKILEPQIVVLSVAKRHLERIAFEPQDNEWTAIHTFDRTGSGAPRSRPYEVMARWYDVDGKPSLFIFGPAAQTPFGLISDPQKGKVGAILREVCRNGR